MTLQSNGPISMQDVVTEFTLTTPTSVQDWYGLADGVPTTGPISFSDMLGKSAVIVKTVSATTTNLNIQTLFTTEEWTASIPKKVVIPAGVIVGSLNPSLPALRTGTGRVYRIEIEVLGEIQGASGAANSGAGGPAIQIEQSEVTVNIRPGGAVRGGGGGGSRGGTGGTGGQGFFYTYPREPSSGDYYDRFGRYMVGGGPDNGWFWEADFGRYNSFFNGGPIDAVSVSNRTYYRGTAFQEWKRTGPDGDGYNYYNYGIYKITTVTNVTGGGAGGTGGAGGRGRGYTLAPTAGSTGAGGSAGSTNAGTGGTGGTGGAGGEWGTSGSVGTTGATGNTGNYTGGSAGAAAAAAGAGGAAVYGVARTITNLGTINGAVV